MQETSITYSDTKKYRIKIREILWRIVFSVTGVVCFLSGLINGYDFKATTFKDGENVALYNFNIFIGIGIGLILCSIYIIYNYRKSKNQLTLRINSVYSNYADEFSYYFGSDGITFKTKNVIVTRKWNYFSTYSNINGFLLLFSKNKFDNFPTEIIPTDVINSEKIENIIKLIESNLGEKTTAKKV
mgnify:CR=1 FL=1